MSWFVVEDMDTTEFRVVSSKEWVPGLEEPWTYNEHETRAQAEAELRQIERDTQRGY